MSGLIPSAGERQLLIRALGVGCSLRLFTNDKEPQKNDTIDSYIEATGHGYSPKQLYDGGWRVLSDEDQVVANHEEQKWTFIGPLGKVYGYYVADSGGAELLWAERFSNGPYDIRNEGDQLKIIPNIKKLSRTRKG